MAQKLANYETDCQECMTYIAQDDPIWFGADGEKLCRNCATTAGRICPQCDGTKRPAFATCFDCKQRALIAMGFRRPL
jgi:hypothetical protein